MPKGCPASRELKLLEIFSEWGSFVEWKILGRIRKENGHTPAVISLFESEEGQPFLFPNGT